MKRPHKTPMLLAIGSAILVAINASAQVEVLMEDDFESYDKTADLIGGDWEEQKFYWNDAACTDYAGEYPQWGGEPPWGGGPAPTQNVSYFTVDANGGGIGSTYGEYTKQGLNDNPNNVSGSLGLEVRQDTYGTNNDACTTHRVFKRFSSTELESGNYKISGRAMISEYFGATSLPAGAAVGVFLTIQDASNNAIVINDYRDITVSQSSVSTIAEDFSVTVGAVTEFNVTVGMFSRNVNGAFGGAIFDDFELSVGGLTEEEEAEIAACEDTSTIRFEEEFGGSEATCASDTYEWPEEAESFGGFADAIRDESLYPFAFQRGGQITFDCTSNSATETQRIRFKFENAPYPNNTPEFFTEWVECPTEGGVLTRLSEVRVADHTGALSVDIPNQAWTNEYDNFLMFLETKGGPSVTVTNVHVTSAYDSEDRPSAPGSDVEPIPVLPWGGLLGLITLLGYMGYRRR